MRIASGSGVPKLLKNDIHKCVCHFSDYLLKFALLRHFVVSDLAIHFIAGYAADKAKYNIVFVFA